MNTGAIKPHHWKLYICLQEAGKDTLREWGEEVEMRTEMNKLAKQGKDVWLIAPNGKKELPTEKQSKHYTPYFITTKLTDAEHGFDDFDITDHYTLCRACVPHGIKKGESFNVYYAESAKGGATWTGELRQSLLNFCKALASDMTAREHQLIAHNFVDLDRLIASGQDDDTTEARMGLLQQQLDDSPWMFDPTSHMITLKR